MKFKASEKKTKYIISKEDLRVKKCYAWFPKRVGNYRIWFATYFKIYTIRIMQSNNEDGKITYEWKLYNTVTDLNHSIVCINHLYNVDYENL